MMAPTSSTTIHILSHTVLQRLPLNRHEKRWGRMLAALTFYLIHFLKLKYLGTLTYITQIVHSNTHLNPLKKIISVTNHF